MGMYKISDFWKVPAKDLLFVGILEKEHNLEALNHEQNIAFP